jgi:hypothetical protein
LARDAEKLRAWLVENRERRNKLARERYRKDPDKAKARSRRYVKRNPEARRNSILKHQYNITLAEYNALLAHQKGVCAVCRQKETRLDPVTKKVTALAVDHDHSHGNIRGLLCSACNKAIGLLRDNPENLRRAAAYLEKWFDAPTRPKREKNGRTMR